MNLNNVIFYEHYPKLDLHGYDRETARVMIQDFIQDHVKLKDEIVVIVHGIGSGILFHTTKEVLRKNKSVLEYKSAFNNQGCTLVLLKIKKEREQDEK